MVLTHRILWAAALFLVVLAHAALTAQTPAKTVWDGVFTAEQAERGAEAYKTSCSECHGGDLAGDEQDDCSGCRSALGKVEPSKPHWISFSSTPKRTRPKSVTRSQARRLAGQCRFEHRRHPFHHLR